MRLNFRQMDDFEGTIASNGLLKLWLDAGPTYDLFMLETANIDTPADHYLVIEKNGDERVRMTLQQLLEREAYEGESATSNYFFFSFVDIMARTLEGENIGGLVTQPGDRVSVSIELGSVDADETFTLFAQTSDARVVEETILRVVPESVPITKAGANPFAGFDRGDLPGHITIRKIFHYGAVTKLSMERDDKTLFGKRELSLAANNARLKRAGKTVPSSCFVLDAVVQGNVITDPVDTFHKKHFREYITTSNTTDVVALTEYVEDLRVKRASQAA